MSTIPTELHSARGTNTLNFELCLRCMEMFRYFEENEYSDYVLFNHDTLHELSPKTCPFCAVIHAVIDLDASECPRKVTGVSCDFHSDDREHNCNLQISGGGYTTSEQLTVLLADSKMTGIITYNY